MRRGGGGPPSRTKSAPRYGAGDHGPLSASQDGVYSQGPLTQAAMMSQPYGAGFSQHLGDLSQSDSIYLGGGATADEFRLATRGPFYLLFLHVCNSRKFW